MKIIIVDDDERIRKQIVKIVNQTLVKTQLNVQTKIFDKYSEELKKEILNSNENIYILDLDLPIKNGFDISRIIRFEVNDWKSIIIIASAYDQKSDFISSQLAIFTYISKFIDFKAKLSDSLNLSLNVLLSDKAIKIDDENVLIDDILCIQKEKSSKYCIIKCFNDEYRVRKSLAELQKETRLEKIRKDLLVNKKNTISINENEIVFKNNIKLN